MQTYNVKTSATSETCKHHFKHMTLTAKLSIVLHNWLCISMQKYYIEGNDDFVAHLEYFM